MINIFKPTSIFSPFPLLSFNSRLPILAFFSSLHTPKHQRLHLRDYFEAIENVDDATTLFHYMLQLKPKPSIYHYHRLFTTILNMEHYALLVVLFKKMIFYGGPVNEYFMSTIITCYCKMNEFDLCFPVIGSFLKRGFAPDIVCFNWLIKGLFMQGDVDKAITLFRSLIRRKFEINEFTMSIVLDGLCKSGDVASACQLLGVAEKNNWKLNVVAYSAMIDGFCKSGMLKDAMALLCRMIDRNILPDVYTYTAFIKGFCCNNKLDIACGIFSDLPSKGVHPNVVTYTVLIQGLCRGGQFQIAKDVLENMERVGFVVNNITCNIVLKECLRHCDNFESIDLLKQIVGRDFQLDASAFFVLLRQIPKIRQMNHFYDDDVINHLMQKLISGDGIYKIDNNVLINSFIQKLY